MLIDRTEYYISARSASFWFFLEDITHTNLIRVCSDDMNICPRTTNPKYYFFICQTDVTDCPKYLFSWTDKSESDYASKILRVSQNIINNPTHIEKIPLNLDGSWKYQVWMAWE